MRTRTWITTLALACTLCGADDRVLAGQMPTYGVSVKASKPAALAKAKTYVWTVSQPSFDKNADRQIVAAVDRELQARGLTKAAAGTGDLTVTYASLSRTDVDLKAKTAKGELRPEFAVGTLLVDVRDGASRTSLFRVRMDQPISMTDPAKLEAEINAAVTAMFAKYPGVTKR